MSGGHFQYEQYKINYIADEIERLIESNDSTEKDDFGYERGRHYRPEVIAEFKKAVEVLRIAQVYAQEIDWLVCDDSGQDSFLKSLKFELAKLKLNGGEE